MSADSFKNVTDRMKLMAEAPVDINPLKHDERRHIQVTVDELRSVADSNPSHPLSLVKRNSVLGFPGEALVVVETTDLEAIMQNMDTKIIRTVEGGTQISRKVLVPFEVSNEE